MIRHNGIEIDRKEQMIRHAGREKWFSRGRNAGREPVMFRMWEAMIVGSINRNNLFDLLYSDDPDGGPVAGPWIIHVRLHQWKNDYGKIKLRLDKTKWGGIVHYRLVPDDVV